MRTKRGSVVRICGNGQRNRNNDQFTAWLSLRTYRVTRIAGQMINVAGFYCPVKSWVLVST